MTEVLKGPGAPKEDEEQKVLPPEVRAVSTMAGYFGFLSKLYGGIDKSAVPAAVEREVYASSVMMRGLLAEIIGGFAKNEDG